jgi:hypothetical protein
VPVLLVQWCCLITGNRDFLGVFLVYQIYSWYAGKLVICLAPGKLLRNLSISEKPKYSTKGVVIVKEKAEE